MSVIWSGITEGGAIVPVQVDESGKVIATAEPRAELWTKTGETLTPSTPSDDIQTSGKLILSGANGAGQIEASDSGGLKVYALPATSGTFALQSELPPSNVSLVPHAYGVVETDVLKNSFGVRSVTTPSTGNGCTITLYNNLSDLNAIVLCTLNQKSTSPSREMAIRYNVIDTLQIKINTFMDSYRGYQGTMRFSFMIYDPGSLSATTKSIPIEILSPPEEES